MARDADTFRSAMLVIQRCGKDINPKEYAFAQASMCHEKGDAKEAARWAEVANAIDLVLENIVLPEHIPVALH